MRPTSPSPSPVKYKASPVQGGKRSTRSSPPPGPLGGDLGAPSGEGRVQREEVAGSDKLRDNRQQPPASPDAFGRVKGTLYLLMGRTFQ